MSKLIWWHQKPLCEYRTWSHKTLWLTWKMLENSVSKVATHRLMDPWRPAYTESLQIVMWHLIWNHTAKHEYIKRSCRQKKMTTALNSGRSGLLWRTVASRQVWFGPVPCANNVICFGAIPTQCRRAGTWTLWKTLLLSTYGFEHWNLKSSIENEFGAAAYCNIRTQGPGPFS